MANIIVDFGHICGSVKPMHAVNNGPAGKNVRGDGVSSFPYFREAHIPYARNHDASFFDGYGGEYTVDVHRIFRNFDADPDDPANYDFECTDQYCLDIDSVGCETFYRLGSRIEHTKKVGTYPPKDFQKWAVICEHIIRHYTEGWANGYHLPMTYWEIWNEPDCRNWDGTNPCWQGTDAQFIDLFVTAFAHLKACFPHLKIGGPAFCGPWAADSFVGLFEELNRRGLKLDFYSFHGYTNEPYKYRGYVAKAAETLHQYGMDDTELILNEWNYVKGWRDKEWMYTLRAEQGLKGASFMVGSMCTCQDTALDMFMYYDARPCGMNGLFTQVFYEPLKGYFAIRSFGELYMLGKSVKSRSDDSSVYVSAAKSDAEAGILLTYYEDLDEAPAKPVTLTLKNLPAGMRAELCLLDAAHDMTPIQELDEASEIHLECKLFDSYMIRFKN